MSSSNFNSTSRIPTSELKTILSSGVALTNYLSGRVTIRVNTNCRANIFEEKYYTPTIQTLGLPIVRPYRRSRVITKLNQVSSRSILLDEIRSANFSNAGEYGVNWQGHREENE